MPHTEGPVPQVQQKEGPMADPHNHTHQRRHTRLGVLAALTLTAALLTVATAPAHAQRAIDESFSPSARVTTTACLGPAADDAGFTDVSMGTHYKNIQCLAHYNITTGRMGGTEYDPNGNVTRSQMALFLHRMATVAGVELDDAMDAGYTDLNGIADTRVNAINRLSNAGIMTGHTTNTFNPLAHVTRAEMALFLANFMVFSTDNSSERNIKMATDGTYTIEMTAGSTLNDSNFDYFKDARRTQPLHVDSAISAIFELGITTGYSDGTFKPNNHVSRAEMATFILRTLAHTNTRPMGLTAQHDGSGGIEVSLRDADFQPEPNEPIDLFSSFYPDYAFNDDGTCQSRYVNKIDPSNRACEIDRGDTTTGSNGNKAYTAAVLKDAGEGLTVTCGTEEFTIEGAESSDAVFWVWTGDLEDEVDDDTELVRVEGVGLVNREFMQDPHHVNVSGGLDAKKNQTEARMGRSVTYTLQLHADPADNKTKHVAAGPDSSGNKYNLIVTHRELAYEDGDNDPETPETRVDDDTLLTNGRLISVSPSVVTPDADGMVDITVRNDDRSRNRDNNDVVVKIELSAFGVDPDDDDYNTIKTFMTEGPNMKEEHVDSPGYSVGFETTVIFSDDKPDPMRYVIAADAPVYRLAQGPNSPVGSHIEISAVDQYGDPVRGLHVNAISNQDGSSFPFVEYFTTGSDGKYRVNYDYRGVPATETLTGFAAIANQDYDHDNNVDTADRKRLPSRNTTNDGASDTVLEEPAGGNIWNLLLPGTVVSDKPTDMVHWTYVGRSVNSPDGGYSGTNLLADDVDNKAFVVNHSGVANEADGPHVYYWDSADTFTVGTTAVTMELFEKVLASDAPVSRLDWKSYNYNRPNDRAQWTISCNS